MSTRAPVKAKNQLKILHAGQLIKVPWLIHGFSTRAGGSSRAYSKGDLNLGFTKDDSRAAVERNRAAFLKTLGAVTRPRRGSKSSSFWPLITLRQVHSDIIHCIDHVPDEPLTGDGLITATPHLLLAIQTADCLPVIIVDVRRRVVGVFHAGWRGTVQRIVEKGVGEMYRCFGSRPRDLKAAIGPGVQGCCYEVGEEVRVKFESQFEYGGEPVSRSEGFRSGPGKISSAFFDRSRSRTQRIAEKNLSRFGGSEPSTVARCRSSEEEHRGVCAVHQLSSGVAFFLPRGKR